MRFLRSTALIVTQSPTKRPDYFGAYSHSHRGFSPVTRSLSDEKPF